MQVWRVFWAEHAYLERRQSWVKICNTEKQIYALRKIFLSIDRENDVELEPRSHVEIQKRLLL